MLSDLCESAPAKGGFKAFMQRRHSIGSAQVMRLVGAILVLVLSLGIVTAAAAGQSNEPSNNYAGTSLWESVRQNNAALRSQVNSPDGGALVYTEGRDWLSYRTTMLVPYSGYIFAGVTLLLLLFWLIRRSIEVPGGESGKDIQRTTYYERVLHWSLVALFLLLAITGFTVTYGRSLLVPLIGSDGFGQIAAIGKFLHNWSGLVFPLVVLLLLVQFGRRNIYEKGDLSWLLKGGGILTDAHLSAGFFNMGEKIMFWLIMLFGLLISISGLTLDFPIFDLGRAQLAVAHVVHSVIAVFFVVLVFSHAFLAAILVKGTLRAMTRGTVDKNWAKAHHERWHDSLEANQNESK